MLRAPWEDQISRVRRSERYSGTEDEKPHRGLRRQHPDTHADRPAPGDPQREGGRSVPADLDRLLRGAGDRKQDLGQPARAPPHHLVILKEKEADRSLPIWIGSFEAQAIAFKIPRPPRARLFPYDPLASA